MWIKINKDIFENSDFKGLNYLYQILSYNPSTSSRPRYNILIDTEKVKETENFKKLVSVEKSLIEFIDLEYIYFSTLSPSIPYQVSLKSVKSHFNIEEAVLFFNQPVSIILENNKNDSNFILAIIKYFGNDNNYNKAQEHIENAWLQFENAGGCGNIPNFLEGFLNQFKTIAKKNNRNLIDYFRGIIIIDSDKDMERQFVKTSCISLLGKLNALGFDTSDIIDKNSGEILNRNTNFHILEKRMMENYLPKQVFQEIKRQTDRLDNEEIKDWLDVYLNLTSKEQLDFLNIPDGFQPKDNKFDKNNVRKEIDNDILSLFELNTSDIQFKKLDRGFKFQGFKNEGNLKSAKESSFKNEMPDWFKKSFISRQNLEERDGKGELQNIQNKINKLL
ncbi:hypothetical protein [Flavobacterium sp.]|jgi:hypothetical protein|uniref:hypothetical protein n=1 Tax=Flavobacterium sp. TaxID=239 RepID=UPI0037C1493E